MYRIIHSIAVRTARPKSALAGLSPHPAAIADFDSLGGWCSGIILLTNLPASTTDSINIAALGITSVWLAYDGRPTHVLGTFYNTTATSLETILSRTLVLASDSNIVTADLLLSPCITPLGTAARLPMHARPAL